MIPLRAGYGAVTLWQHREQRSLSPWEGDSIAAEQETSASSEHSLGRWDMLITDLEVGVMGGRR